MSILSSDILIPIAGQTLSGILTVPPKAVSLVIFSHGSGSSRLSPRNTFVAHQLHALRIATLLVDLLTEQEDEVYDNRFNIDVLTNRLVAITQYMIQQPAYQFVSIGYFGASTGAASALRAAAQLHPHIDAVVSRGGRPDLAAHALALVRCPTLLLVGSLDTPVIPLNEEAYQQMHCPKKLVLVHGATHLFEEPGKLEEVSTLAADWFQTYLCKRKAPTSKQLRHDI